MVVYFHSFCYKMSRISFIDCHSLKWLSTVYVSFPSFIFSIYTTWMYTVVMNIFPFSCLAIFNLQIYFQIRKANQERAKLSRLQQKEIGLATMLLCVVIVFFACNILAVVNNVLEVSKYLCNIVRILKWGEIG